MKIAILDDDTSTLQIIEQALKGAVNELNNPECRFFTRGTNMLEVIKNEPFDCLVLDRQIPDMSGDVILQWVRQYSLKKFGFYTNVIMLTHLRTEADELYSLRAGADDYITKPFKPAILVQRIYRLYELRRILTTPQDATQIVEDASKIIDNSAPFTFLGYEINPFERLVTLPSGKSVSLTRLESDLARYFFKHANIRLSREKIINDVWQKHFQKNNSRALDTHIYKLRTSLQLSAEHGFDLRTIYGFGYCLYVHNQK